MATLRMAGFSRRYTKWTQKAIRYCKNTLRKEKRVGLIQRCTKSPVAFDWIVSDCNCSPINSTGEKPAVPGGLPQTG